MKRKDYLIPKTQVVRLRYCCQLLSGSTSEPKASLGSPQSASTDDWD